MQTDQSRSPSPHAYEQYFQSEKLNIFSAGHYEFFFAMMRDTDGSGLFNSDPYASIRVWFSPDHEM